jgi:hypothetical protein
MTYCVAKADVDVDASVSVGSVQRNLGPNISSHRSRLVLGSSERRAAIGLPNDPTRAAANCASGRFAVGRTTSSS